MEFHEKLALSQALPGVNVVNLTLWLGYSLRGTIGALVAVFGTILPPAVLIVTAGSFIHKAADAPLVAQFLAGVAAAALGFSINMGIRAARHALVDVASLLVFTLTVIGAFLHVPLVLIVGAMGPVSIGLAYWRLRHGKR
ncbi:chromate transporter [Pararhizobium capsulatum DSM 1112]|uniref:Chromate transporter n=1 Tax=Pararhizobium capsulatum DSM 1112 TaxID=1121113 RepID=A0ABU0C036_9HYPH|nr:chromate transporter [Pararhizobium capsulatum DSM 1112]